MTTLTTKIEKLFKALNILSPSNWIRTGSAPAGFESHLNEAIELYSLRKRIYSELTQSRSDALFFKLILIQKLLKPFSRYYDLRGKKFNQEGIGIIKDDFICMIAPFPPDQGIITAEPYNRENYIFAKKVADSFLSYKHKDTFVAITEHAISAIKEIESYEQDKTIYLRLLKHVVESIGFGALHAHNYEILSNGATNILATDFINLQVLGLRKAAIHLDREANALHQLGIGVLVNDLPHIPIVSEFQRFKETAL